MKTITNRGVDRISAKVLGLMLLCGGVSLPATARQVAQIEEIIVTAQKREKSLQDVPMSVSAVGREALESNEISNIEDLAKLVPSLRLSPGADPTDDSLRVRGVGTDVYSIAVEPNVSVVVDEVPLARTSIASFEFADLERVEVMRGPQGTLFGKNSTAGLIHVISRDPADEFEAFARVVHETPDTFAGNMTNVQGGISGPIADSIGARFTGFYKTSEGHIEDVAQDEYVPGRDSFGGRAKLMWDGDAVTVRLNAEFQRSTGETTPLIFRSLNPSARERSPEISYGEENRSTKSFGNLRADIDNFGTSVKIDWDLGDVTLTSVSGWRDYYIVRNLSLLGIDGDRIDLPLNGGDREIKTITQELRLTSNGESTFDYTVGTLWFQNRLRNEFERRITNVPASYLISAGSPVPLPLPMAFPSLPTAVPGESFGSYAFTAGEVETRNLGVFAQGTWHFSEDWHLTVGGRFIYEKLIASRRTHDHIYNEATGAEFLANDFEANGKSIDDKTGIGTLSLQHDLSETSMLYTTLSTGYRGGAIDMASSNPADAFANPVDPETSEAFEIGLKSRFFDNRLEVNVALFRTIFSDFQAQVLDLNSDDDSLAISPLAFRLDNAGELETRGVELDFQARPLAGVFMYGSVLYNEARFNEFETQCFVGQQPGEKGGVDSNGDGTCDYQDVAGGRMPNAPEWSVSLTTRYEQPLDGGASNAYVQLSGRYVSDIQFNAEQHPGAIQEAYQLWDARVGWMGFDDRLEIAGYVKNLFAQNYVALITPLSVSNDRRDLLHSIPRGADRQFGLSVGYQF